MIPWALVEPWDRIEDEQDPRVASVRLAYAADQARDDRGRFAPENAGDPPPFTRAEIQQVLSTWQVGHPPNTVYSVMPEEAYRRAEQTGTIAHEGGRGELWVTNHASAEYVDGPGQVLVAFQVHGDEMLRGGHGGDFTVKPVPFDRVVDTWRPTARVAYTETQPRDERGRWTSGPSTFDGGKEHGDGEAPSSPDGWRPVSRSVGSLILDRSSARYAATLDRATGVVAEWSADPGYTEMGHTLTTMGDRSDVVWGENADGLPQVYDDAASHHSDWIHVFGEQPPNDDDSYLGAVLSAAADAAALWQSGQGVASVRNGWEDREGTPASESVGHQVLYDLLDRAPVHDGPLYREMYVEDAKSLIESLKPGERVEGLAGWSANEGVANIFGQAYATEDGYVRDSDPEFGFEEWATAPLVKEMVWTPDRPDPDYIVHMTVDGGVPALPVGLVAMAGDDDRQSTAELYAWQQEHLVGAPLEVVSVDVYPPEETEVFTLPTEGEDGNPIRWQSPGLIRVTFKAAE